MEPRAAQLLIGLVACARSAPPASSAPVLAPSPQATAWYLQGALLREEGDAAGAIEAFGRAAAFDPFDPAPLLAASGLHLQRQEAAAALRLAEQAAERAPGSADQARAAALLALGRPAEALDAGGDALLAAAALLALGRPAEACARLAALPPAPTAAEVRRRQPIRAAAACLATSG